MSAASPGERVIKVADIDPRHRHAILFRLFEHLPPTTRCRSSRITTAATPSATRGAPWLALRLVIPRGRPRCLARPSAPPPCRRRMLRLV